MIMKTTNPKDIVTEDLAITKSSKAISSAHHHDHHLLLPHHHAPPRRQNEDLDQAQNQNSFQPMLAAIAGETCAGLNTTSAEVFIITTNTTTIIIIVVVVNIISIIKPSIFLFQKLQARIRDSGPEARDHPAAGCVRRGARQQTKRACAVRP